MTWWALEPHDPLMVRDGRPFGTDTEGARSLSFPPPSVMAGTLRSRVGFAVGDGAKFGLTPAEAREIPVRGPLLAEEASDGALRLLLPAPLDCVLFEADRGTPWRRYRLGPAERPAGDDSSLPANLSPVAPAVDMPNDKPAQDAPSFWDAHTFQSWLAAPPAHDTLERAATAPPLTHERRIHLQIDPTTLTGEDGKLFGTDGLRLVAGERGAWRRRVLLARCADARLSSGLVPLGGERRLSALTPTTLSDVLWAPPPLPAPRARVVLLTPALFENGASPDHIEGARVCAAAVRRPLVISGWDIAKRGPKSTRRMVPAGSVYWVEIPDNEGVEEWTQRVHLREISDGAQDRLDGFGLAAVGVWA